jgi:hypothetical protein
LSCFGQIGHLDIVGTRATGWIKQLTGAVDQSMTDTKGIPADAVNDFRQANEIYSQMKATYDNPTSTLYHVVRSAYEVQAGQQAR